MSFRYPVVLDLDARPCLVVGGGVVAERKARGLLESGARVTVLSPALCPGLMTLATEGCIAWRPREYRGGDAAGFFLVVGATGDRPVNALVAAEGRRVGALVNCADDPEHCDFILPSVLHRGAITVAVSTGGASPTLARRVREELDALLPVDYAAMADVVADVRRRLRERGASATAETWRSALDLGVRRLAAAGRLDEARQRLEERLGA